MINIGIPSKGRLRKDVLKIFKNKKMNLISERGERDLFGSIKKLPNAKIIYLHAREIIERLADGSLDIGFSGYDLLKEYRSKRGDESPDAQARAHLFGTAAESDTNTD